VKCDVMCFSFAVKYICTKFLSSLVMINSYWLVEGPLRLKHIK
jgi:hypothetical protein